MGALLWLLIPVLAAISAAVWSSWVSSGRRNSDGAEVAGYDRFREAMEKSRSGSDAA